MEEMDAAGIDERALLERTHATLTRITGRAPRGFRAPHGRLTERTLPHLAELGYRYDASFQDDDHPYRLDKEGGRGMIEVPHAEILIDGKEHDQAQALLRSRYPQLKRMQIAELPVIAVRIVSATSWGNLSLGKPD